MKLKFALSTLACSLALYSLPAFAQTPTGSRVVTLRCGQPLGVKDGAFYYGAASLVKITRNNNKAADGQLIAGVKTQTVEFLKSAMFGPPTVLPTTNISSNPFTDNLFSTKDETKIYTFHDTNCLKATLSATVISGNEAAGYAIANCTQIESDTFTGSDIGTFCN